MGKVKILIDLKFLANINSGLGQVCVNYGRTLNSINPEDLDITVLVPSDYMGKFGDHIKYLKHSKKYKYFPFLLPACDVWHSTAQQVKYLPLNYTTKKIMSIHDLNFLYEEAEEKAQRRLKRMQFRVNQHDKITAISEFVAGDIRKHIDLKGKDITVVDNGVELLNPDLAEKPPFIQTDRPFFFTIGQISAKKNFHVLLDLMKMYPDHDLYVAGENFREYALEMQDRIKNESIANVFLPGTVSENEKIWLYQHCEAFLFPSKFEGFGLPVIEALEFGKPVFTSRSTCLEGTGKEHVYYWDNFEAEHMKTVMEKGLQLFHNDPQKIETIKKYAAGFSYERHINTYLDIYRQLATEEKKKISWFFFIQVYLKSIFY